MATINEKMTNLANAVRAKSGVSGKLSIDGMTSALNNIPTKAASTITPGTSNKTIAAGTYLTGTQTISGDADLIASNIKKGVNIFGVAGNYAGVELNFTIVTGTSQPSSPSENTLWINTSTSYSKYTFASEQNPPSNPSAGDLWIVTASKTNITFNALKSTSPIMISVYKCKQYISSAWVDKIMKCYQNSSWKTGLGYFYKDGVFDNLFGGFSSKNYYFSDTSSGGITITNNGTSITLAGPTKGRSSSAMSSNKIDLTNLSHIYFKAQFTATDTSANRCHVGISNMESGVSLPLTKYSTAGAGSILTHTIDVSGYTGQYYVGFGGHNYGTLQAVVYEISYD